MELRYATLALPSFTEGMKKFSCMEYDVKKDVKYLAAASTGLLLT